MILGTATSKNGVTVRLTDERWEHVLDDHPSDFSYNDFETVLDVVEDPDYILRERHGSLAAVVSIGRRFLNVFYKELAGDGFIITAYMKAEIDRKKIVWRKDNQ